MFEREILFWPGVALAAVGVVLLIFRRSWRFDVVAAFGLVAGGFLIHEAQRDGPPDEIEWRDLFSGTFEGWSEAILVALMLTAILVLTLLIARRSLPAWERVVAVAVGVTLAVMAVQLWDAGGLGW